MNNCPLKKYADYVSEKISTNQLNVSDYVTTDNILQNKQGITLASSLPAQSGKVTKYRTGDILLANIRPYLKKIWFSQKTGGCSADVLVFRAKENINPNFLYYALFRDDFFNHVMNGAKGTKMPRGDKTQIMEFSIPEFDKNIQNKIAQTLSCLDKKIELNNRINAELEAMAKTLYDYWFVQFDFPDANGKPYKTAGGKMVYNPTLKREIPEGWSNIKLNQLLTNKPQSINVSQISKEEPYTPIDYLPSRKMSFGEYAPSSEASTSLIKYNKGDILIGAMRVYFHRVCVAPFNGITRQTTMVLKPNNFSFLPFLYQVCNEDRAINFANIISVGTQQPYVNWDNGFENYEIPFPSNINIIEKYCSSVESIVNSVIQRNLENNRLTELRDWLLPMLMNGQVTVNS